MYTVMNCFGMDRRAAAMKTNIFMPHTAKMAVVTSLAISTRSIRTIILWIPTMTGDGTVPCDQRNLETTLSNQF